MLFLLTIFLNHKFIKEHKRFLVYFFFMSFYVLYRFYFICVFLKHISHIRIDRVLLDYSLKTYMTYMVNFHKNYYLSSGTKELCSA